MPRKREPESAEESQSRKNLRMFFEVTERVLQQVFDAIQSRWSESTGAVAGRTSRILEHLDIVRTHAFGEVKGTLRLLRNGLNRNQRRALNQVGLMGATLGAKLELLWELIREHTLAPILKHLNSFLGSLGMVLKVCDALKEFKEMMEIAIDKLGPESDPITINLNASELPELG